MSSFINILDKQPHLYGFINMRCQTSKAAKCPASHPADSDLRFPAGYRK